MKKNLPSSSWCYPLIAPTVLEGPSSCIVASRPVVTDATGPLDELSAALSGGP